MRLVFTSIAVCGACVVAGCSTSSPYLTAAPPVAQTAAVAPEPAPIRTAPRPRRPAVARARAAGPETTSSVSDAKPVVYNSPEWKEREKRRDEELNRKIYNICRGC
jgi:hypothetical protein